MSGEEQVQLIQQVREQICADSSFTEQLLQALGLSSSMAIGINRHVRQQNRSEELRVDQQAKVRPLKH